MASDLLIAVFGTITKILRSYLTTPTLQCGATLSPIVDIGRLHADDLEAVFKKRVHKKMGYEDAPMHNPRRMNKGLEPKRGVITIIIRSLDIIDAIRRVDGIVDTNNNNNHNKIKQATGHSVNGKISAIPINLIDGIDHGDDHRYNTLVLHLLPGFHECKIWEAARATSAAPTYFRDMFIDMSEAMALDLIKRNICHTINLGCNSITNEFNFSYLFLIDKVAIDLNHDQCTQNFYHPIKNKNIYTKTHRNKKINETIDTINQILGYQSDNNDNNNFTIQKLTKNMVHKKMFDVNTKIFQDGGLMTGLFSGGMTGERIRRSMVSLLLIFIFDSGFFILRFAFLWS